MKNFLMQVQLKHTHQDKKNQLGVHYKIILYYFSNNKFMLSQAVVFTEF